jgi:hypothetical protein
MADRFKCYALKFEGSFNPRKILKDELLTNWFVDFAICKSETLKLFPFDFFLEFVHHVYTEHAH